MEIKELFTVKEAYGATLLYCKNIRRMKKEDYKKIVNMLKAIGKVCNGGCSIVAEGGQLFYGSHGTEWFPHKTTVGAIAVKTSLYLSYKVLGDNENAHSCYLEAKKLK